MDVNVVQCNDLLIIPESFSYNCCVLNFDLVDLQTLVNLNQHAFFFNLKNTNGTCNTITS